MNVRFLFVLAFAVAMSACAGSAAPKVGTQQPSPNPSPTAVAILDLTNLLEKEWQQQLGRIATARGKFSQRGVVGPYITIGKRLIYIEPNGKNARGEEYDRLEGKTVNVTGTLRFRDFEEGPEQHPPDYFYFEEETVKIERVK